MADLQPIMVTRNTAAKLLELTFHEFDRLVEGGVVAKGHKLDADIIRWRVDELHKLCQTERPKAEVAR